MIHGRRVLFPLERLHIIYAQPYNYVQQVPDDRYLEQGFDAAPGAL